MSSPSHDRRSATNSSFFEERCRGCGTTFGRADAVYPEMVEGLLGAPRATPVWNCQGCHDDSHNWNAKQDAGAA